MAGMTVARQAFAKEVEHAVPPDDPLRPLLDRMVSLTAELEAAEMRVGQDYADRLARVAALGAQQHALALVRAEMRRTQVLLACTMALVGLAGIAVGWLLALRL